MSAACHWRKSYPDYTKASEAMSKSTQKWDWPDIKDVDITVGKGILCLISWASSATESTSGL